MTTTLQQVIAPPPPPPPTDTTATATATAKATPLGGSAAATPDSRSTTFVPVEGNATEQHSGSTLLIEAYSVLWILLMTWLFMLWRKQSRLHARLDDLERVLDRAAAAPAKKP